MKIVLKIVHQIVYVSSKGFCSVSKNGFFMADLVKFLDTELQSYVKCLRNMLKSCPLNCTFI